MRYTVVSSSYGSHPATHVRRNLSLPAARRIAERTARKGAADHYKAECAEDVNARLHLVNECLRVAAEYRVAGNYPAARAWIARARMWRSNYQAEIAENRDWRRLNGWRFAEAPTIVRENWGARGGLFPIAYRGAAIYVAGCAPGRA